MIGVAGQNRAYFVIVFLCVFAIQGARPAIAHPATQSCANVYSWNEISNETFSIIYPLNKEEYFDFSQSIRLLLDEQLADEFANYGAIFQTQLPTPITIRIYPDLDVYYCLNPLANPIADGDYHTHLGSREIAFIGDRLNTPETQWDIAGVNAFRAEIASLYAEARSKGNAPPGLIAGVGAYAENPNEMYQRHLEAVNARDLADQSLQSVWEEPLASSLPATRFLATSSVAYLIDVYGWSAFLSFLDELANAQGYRAALDTVYDLSAAELNTHWQDVYHPVYLNGRWRANLFHNFDLSAFETMIDAGAYSDAAAGLNDAMPVIEKLGTVEEFVRAEQLLAQAQFGQSATVKMESARKALLDGDFDASLAFAEEAAAIYGQLGGNQRQDELNAYIDWSTRVLTLRAELAQLADQGAVANPIAPRRIAEIGEELGKLGDAEGVGAAQVALGIVSERARGIQFGITVAGVLLALYLLARRLLKMFQKAPPEANLI
jgi:hypothetical protein